MPATISLADLGVHHDPGTAWHPRKSKASARDRAGNLRDLSDDEVLQHQAKPEVAGQIDAGVLLEAEDSEYSRDGEV